MEAPTIVYIEIVKYLRCTEAQKRASVKYFQKPEVKEKRRLYAQRKRAELKARALDMVGPLGVQEE